MTGGDDCVSREEFQKLAHEVQELRRENKDLRDELETEREERRAHEEEIETLRGDIVTLRDELNTKSTLLTALKNKSNGTREMVGELQARELEKGAHLRWETVESTVEDPRIEVGDGTVEQITKDDGREYARLPASDDPLERGGDVALAHADLLPIQQLARMDDEMLRTHVSTMGARLAVKAWQERDRDEFGLWERGSGEVREFVNASDLRHFILAQEEGVNSEYAKKLVTRTIDALLELSRNKLGVKKCSRRKDGLNYKERRVVLTTSTKLPGEVVGGETDEPPGTSVDHGE